MRIYEASWQDIPEKGWPKAGEIFVCLDPQKRLGNETWSVAEFHDHDKEIDIIGRGLFWTKEDAIVFAKTLAGGN
jgi:hypothetical protein